MEQVTERLFDPGPKAPPNPTFNATVEIKTNVRIDLKRFFENRLDHYLAYKLERGYQPWEKPMCFLHEWLVNESGYSSFWTPEREVTHDFGDDIEIDFDRFSEEDALALHDSLGLNPEGTEPIL